tara:strand:+ start:308 stop:1579 length:1272 start_codon:yes stop_codon:yes gene_type:complete
MNNRLIILILTLLSLGFSQGYMNAIGLGKFYSNQGVYNAMDGVNTLAPSVLKNVNFSNPSTWHNLKFTYLSLSYSADQTSFENFSLANAYSGIPNALWVIPIKSKYSFGLSISPYINQKVSLVELGTVAFIAFEDTLQISRSFKRSGGLLALNMGSSYQLSQKISLGIMTNVLFGSSRQSESVKFNGSNIIQTTRSRYNGLISNFFLSMKLRNEITLYSSFKKTLKPVENARLEKHLFDDANSNGFHDWSSPYFDFPFPDSVTSFSEYRISDVHNPAGLQFGISKILNKKWSLAFEWTSEFENSKGLKNIDSPMNNWIYETNSFKTSLSRFANPNSLNIFDKISIRSGLQYSSYTLGNSEKVIQEYGCSIGSGYKFKSVGNQIDLNFCFGYRDYPTSSSRELYQQLQMSISLADIWFIKRRQK